MDVKFWNPSKIASPYKALNVNGDTLNLFYTPFQLSINKLSKTSGITGVETSPRPEYYRIQKVYISKAPGKEVTSLTKKIL